jgi:hypothetical protein
MVEDVDLRFLGERVEDLTARVRSIEAGIGALNFRTERLDAGLSILDRHLGEVIVEVREMVKSVDGRFDRIEALLKNGRR